MNKKNDNKIKKKIYIYRTKKLPRDTRFTNFVEKQNGLIGKYLLVHESKIYIFRDEKTPEISTYQISRKVE